ncbi:hypothetical protein [Roseateles asaccharophilus]|uniref:Uncharacterized protein n=1 Tax=Roseateles asaccharophilus TaxID=582607 RepID=A0ABU2AFV0_9BURK|nr:hypothetical protein [Roseateles asaccharophilus]MDR7335488.1 hypothetical protein [Roseateles asaccharophilus]
MTSLRHSLTRWLAPMLLGLAGLTASSAQAADVGVSIGFSQPGVYGRVDIGRYPHPVLIAPQPVYVGRPSHREPVYLWVPPDHRRHWNRHCGRYGACGAPVYFVEDRWYRGHVVQHHHHRDRHHHDHRRHDRHDRHDHRDHHDRDRGHGHRH